MPSTGDDPSGVDPGRFATDLATVLQQVVPDTVAVQPAGDDLAFAGRGDGSDRLGRAGSHVGQFFGLLADRYADDASRVLAACLHAMSDLQDFVAEATTDPWPNRGPGVMPEPHGRIGADGVDQWFGDEGRPVLTLPRMPAP